MCLPVGSTDHSSYGKVKCLVTQGLGFPYRLGNQCHSYPGDSSRLISSWAALFGLVRQVGRLDERLKIASQRTRFFKKEINNTIIQHAYETFFMSDQIPDFQD